jgi:hypothetical protein
VKLGKKVTCVETQDPRVGAGGVNVVTDDGHRQTFDGVVMTTPLGWLKRNTECFIPSLDRRLLDAIDSISVGHLEKVSADLQVSARSVKPTPRLGLHQIPLRLLARLAISANSNLRHPSNFRKPQR